MHRFYVPGVVLSGELQLPDEEAQHLARVLRIKAGDSVAVFDGRGQEAIARVETVAPRRVTVRITGPRLAAREPAVALTLAQALLKSDKMDRVIRDAVMLGAAAVQPFVSKRTDVPRAALRTGVRHERWMRTVISSVKQSGRAVVPPVLEARDFRELLPGNDGLTRLMFVEPGAVTSGMVSDLRSLEDIRPSKVMVLIGPEGGWDSQEIADGQASGVMFVTFGSRTLRADAAGAAAIAVLQYVWKDL